MKILIYYMAMVSLTVSANLLFKMGADKSSGEILSLLNARVVLGFVCFGVASLFYVVVLTKLPLNVAQSFAAIQFVAVIVAAHFFLGEPIDGTRLVGIGLIFSGIMLVGKSVA